MAPGPIAGLLADSFADTIARGMIADESEDLLKKRRALRLASQHERVYMCCALILREQQQKEWSGRVQMKVPTVIGCSILYAVIGGSASRAQAPAGGSGIQMIGEVVAINGQSNQITLKTEKNEPVSFSIAEKTPLRRVPAGAKDLTSAVRIALTDIAVGDRIVARVQKTEDQKFTATLVLVMAKSDLAQQRQREQEDWQKRGTTGIIIAVDASSKTFTVRVGPKTLTVHLLDNTDYRRYAADSVKFSDAQPSSLAALKSGDQVRILGDNNEDGASIKAERIVSGFFRQIAGTITSMNPEAHEIVIRDLATKKPLVVSVNADSTIKKLPPQTAAALAGRYRSGRPGGASGDAPAGDVGHILDLLAPMPFAELKPGDAIMLLSTAGADPARVTAITLLAGVEVLLTASPDAARDIMGGWNLGGSAGGDQ